MIKRLLIGVTGASGGPLSVELLRQLRAMPEVETHLIVTEYGAKTVLHETGLTMEALAALSDRVYDDHDCGAAPASGSFPLDGMVIVPCSMKTLAGVVSGYCETLLLRAADVALKERRRLVLVPRESPLSTLHLRNLATASELGAMIVPPVPAWYNHPQTVDDVNRQIVGKVLSLFGLDTGLVSPWEGL